MQVYYVKSTYNGSTYKLSDFYNNESYILNPNKLLDINLVASDGATSFKTSNLTLPDETSIRDYTHIIVPDYNKIYEILSITYLNVKQWKVNLMEDVFIGKYYQFNKVEANITRSNQSDLELYQGFNDLNDLSTDFTTEVKPVESMGSGALLGDWLLVYAQNLDQDQRNNYNGLRFNVNLDDAYKPYNTHNIANANTLESTYPSSGPYTETEAKANIPFYYGEYAVLDNDPDTILNFTAFKNSEDDKIYFTWLPVNNGYKYEDSEEGWSNYSDYAEFGTANLLTRLRPSLTLYFRTDRLQMYIATPLPGVWTKFKKADAYGNGNNRPTNPADGFVYFNTTSGKLEKYNNSGQWSDGNRLYIGSLYDGDELLVDVNVNMFPNQPVIIFALPLNSRVSDADTHLSSNPLNLLNASSFKSIEWLDGSSWTAFNVLSTKIINGGSIWGNLDFSVMGTEGISENWSQYYIKTGLKTNYAFFDSAFTNQSPFQLAVLDYQETEFDLSLNEAISGISDYEPFKTYELWVYGQKYDIPAIFVNSLHMKQNINTNGINYSIYRDKEKTKLYLNGTISMDSQWSADQLALYAQTNPTYKDEFNLRQEQKWTQVLVGGASAIGTGTLAGAAAGSVVPGLGTAVGAATGLAGGVANATTSLVNTAVQTKFDKMQFELMQRSKQKTQDSLFGDGSSSYQYFNVRKGIYWIVKTNNNVEKMLIEYYKKGYPTNVYKSINSIDWAYNGLFESQSKIVSGYFLKTIENNWTTKEINKNLAEGVIILE